MGYIDGFVAAVPTENREAYAEHARTAAEIFKRHGALSVVECWGEDVPDGELTSFPMAVKCGADETVVFAWIAWPSKAVRDAGMQAIMTDEQLTGAMRSMPFDGKRLIYGGFDVLLEL